MSIRIADIRARFSRETEDCEADGSAVQAWVEAREIPMDELEHEVKTMLAFCLLAEDNPMIVGINAFRIGYEFAVARERAALFGGEE